MAYRQYNNRNNSNRRFNNNRRRQFRGRRQVRSFDPTYLINKKIEPTKVEIVKIDNDFSDFQINENLKTNIKNKGYQTPTPIQDKTIPLILKGKDVVGVANTGTGKTAAFLIPLIDKILKNNKIKVLIITPTRELAVQIQEEFISIARGLKLYSALCIGGVNMGGQIRQLNRKPQFVIGTPGRLKDLEQRRILDLRAFTTIVLDEKKYP